MSMDFSWPVLPSGLTTKFVDERIIAVTCCLLLLFLLLRGKNNWKRPIVSILEMLKCENRCILKERTFFFFSFFFLQSSATQKLTSVFDLYPIPVQAFTVLNLGQCNKNSLECRGKGTGFGVWRPESDSALWFLKWAPLGVKSLFFGETPNSEGFGGLMYAKIL